MFTVPGFYDRSLTLNQAQMESKAAVVMIDCDLYGRRCLCWIS